MNNLENMIWFPGWNFADCDEPVVAYFRKKIMIKSPVTKAFLKISADTRYKLYINGVFVQEGPQKGDLESWHFDTADLQPYVGEGENIVAVQVLRFPENVDKRNRSLFIGPKPFLYVEGSVSTQEEDISLDAGKGYRCRRAAHVQLKREPFVPAPIHGIEEVTADPAFTGWMLPLYDDALWDVPVSALRGDEFLACAGQINMKERTIPKQEHKVQRFAGVVCVREPEDREVQLRTEMEGLLREEKVLNVPAETKYIVEISAGELMCGYLRLALTGGADAKITIHCAESYSREAPFVSGSDFAPNPVKTDRTDYVYGQLRGVEDVYHAAGNGTENCPEIYEPFWFSTFRFIRLTIETAAEDLTIKSFSYTRTGYPLVVKTKAEASDPDFQDIWDISERTLRRCMHETYMDCPFYEQLSYAMDSRAEILFTYVTAADDRLARRCMEDFKRSQRADGMINSCAPTTDINVIPGFSIYYILMVHDHMMYFGDKELVKDHLPVIDGILRYFDRNTAQNGMVAKIGGPLFREYYWSFVDWTKEWNETSGVPRATLSGPITVESLLYSIGLSKAAELAEYVGRADQAKEYRQRAIRVNEAVRAYAMGENGLIQDGPGIDEYSCHGQVFAVLSGAVSVEEGKRMLKEVVGNPSYAQCSVSMSFYLFRALEKVGQYEMTRDLWDLWRTMVKNHMTTCVENGTDGRSDCHAWGALLLYELPATILGVRPTAPGYSQMEIRPVPGYLDWAKGDVITSRGIVHVEWKKKANGEIDLQWYVDEIDKGQTDEDKYKI